TFLTGTIWLSLETFTAISNNGNPPLGKTGAPGENNCTECHTGSAVNTGGAQVKSEYIYNGTVDSFYNPDFGQGAYSTGATLVESGSEASGIELTMVDKNGKGAGEFAANNTNKTATASSNGKSYFFHTKKENPNPNANDWTATWTPPTTNVGTLTMYTAINGSNNDNTDQGDFIYTLKSTIKIDPGYNGVEWQKNNALKFAVFPSTVSDVLNVNYTNNKDQQISIELYDLKGNKVHTFLSVNQHQGENSYKFDMPKVAGGMYLVKMSAGAQQTTKRIFVL
ncbi:MAG: T9SS type A sorting domain-containing protein, partial [Bacteroidetes bacterium]|nr:T9SS type A sorting domain-containing protein [Bacteroidota bacterium]